MNNNKILEQYTKQKVSLKVKQIDIATGKVINIFNNRYQAATWVLNNGLTNYFYQSVGKTRACIAGALTVAIQKDSNAYGYKWILLPLNNKEKATVFFEKLSTGIATQGNRGRTVKIITKDKKIELPSIKSAAIYLSKPLGSVEYNLAKYKKINLPNTIVELKRKSPKSLEYMKNLNKIQTQIPVVAKNIATGEFIKFSSMTKASEIFKIDRKAIKNSITQRKPHKGIQWKLLLITH